MLPALVLLLCAWTGGVTFSDSPRAARYAGRPLREALADLQAGGLSLIYSSDLVRPDMTVVAEPRATEPRLQLAELLAPHRLAAREGPGGILLIVPAAAAPEAGDGQPAPRRRTDPARPERPLRSDLDEEIHVSGEGDGRDPAPAETTTISGADLLRDASLGDDAQRALARQPGTAAGDRSAQLFVRGGEAPELAVVLDGLRIREPFHLKSFLSPAGVIDANALASAEFSSGNFPAETGDALSGVVNLFSSDPSGPPHMSLQASGLDTRLLFDGLFAAGEGQWLVTGRRFYPDVAVDMETPEADDVNPRYGDLFAKARIRTGEGTVVSGDVLVSGDNIDFGGAAGQENIRVESASRHAWLGVKTALTPRLLSETIVASGSIESGRFGSLGSGPAPAVLVDDHRSFDFLAVRQDWSWQVSGDQELRGGLAAEHGEAEYDSVRAPEASGPVPGPPAIPGSPQPRLIAQPSGYTLGAYLADRLRLLPSLTADVGLRWDAQTYAADRQVSPRVNLVQTLGGSLLRAGWGRYYQSQGLDELQIEDGVGRFYPAQLAEQTMLGFERRFSPRLSLRIDAYRKEMSQLRPRYENLFNPVAMFPEIEPDRIRIDPSRAEARGVELSLLGDGGPGFGWRAGYARASARDEIDGRWVARSWDQRDTFTFGVGYRRGSAWELNLEGLYHSGWPTTGVSAVMVTNTDGTAGIVPALGPRNAERFPAYHRLDFKVRRSFEIGRGHLALFAEVTNLYDHHNVCCAEGFRYIPLPDGGVRVDREDGYWLQQTPVFGLAWDSGP